jgi:hypothetical protein
MPRYSGESGSSQVIRPGWGQDPWGVRMQEEEVKALQAKMMMLGRRLGKKGGEGVESEEIDMDELMESDPDFAEFEPDIEDGAMQETSLAASGMEEQDPFFGDEGGAEEMYPGGDEFESRAMDFGTDDPRVNEEKAAQLAAMQLATGNRLGQGPRGEYEMAQSQAQFDPLQQTGQYAGTGLAPMPPSQEQIAMAQFEEQNRYRRRMGGIGGGGSRYRGY